MSVVPPISLAAEEKVTATEQSLSQEETDQAYTYTEITEMRDSFTKHFRRSDGKIVAIVYPEVMHTEKDGEMVDVDNRLSYSKSLGAYRTTDVMMRFDDNDTQIYIFEYYDDGYFRIKAKQNNLYLTVPGGSTALGVSVTHQELALNDSEGQQWMVVPTMNGQYKLYTKAASNLDSIPVLCTEDGGIRQDRWFAGKYGLEDEWSIGQICVAQDIELEAQSESEWCWAAAALMFAKNYYPSISVTQSQIVEAVTGSVENAGGTPNDISSAVEFCINSVGGTLDLEGEHGFLPNIYSEDIIKLFLDNGHVLLVGRQWIGENGLPKRRHAVVVYGYCYINGQCYFLIKDPIGQHSILSYTKLCDSLNANSNDQSDSADTRSIWSATIVAKTSYSEIPIVE